MSSGDGWTYCDAGHRHWGRHGAAGLLLVRDAAVLLQLRAPQIHHGGTWSIPGGARNSHESAMDAALREAREEVGMQPSQLTSFAEFLDDHGGWSYTTVMATSIGALSPVHNFESTEVRWVPIGQVDRLPLHPGFAASWHLVAATLQAESIVERRATPPGSDAAGRWRT